LEKSFVKSFAKDNPIVKEIYYEMKKRRYSTGKRKGVNNNNNRLGKEGQTVSQPLRRFW
jgi:hypothetical protein